MKENKVCDCCGELIIDKYFTSGDTHLCYACGKELLTEFEGILCYKQDVPDGFYNDETLIDVEQFFEEEE